MILYSTCCPRPALLGTHQIHHDPQSSLDLQCCSPEYAFDFMFTNWISSAKHQFPLSLYLTALPGSRRTTPLGAQVANFIFQPLPVVMSLKSKNVVAWWYIIKWQHTCKLLSKLKWRHEAFYIIDLYQIDCVWPESVKCLKIGREAGGRYSRTRLNPVDRLAW